MEKEKLPILPTHQSRTGGQAFFRLTVQRIQDSFSTEWWVIKLWINQPPVSWPKSRTSIAIPISMSINKFQTIHLCNCLMQLVFRLGTFWIPLTGSKTIIIIHSNEWLQLMVKRQELLSVYQQWPKHDTDTCIFLPVENLCFLFYKTN